MSGTATAEEFRPGWGKKFFTIWGGQALSLVGSALVQFALVWWLTVRTGSATILATATLMALLPQIVLGPFAGTLVDRWKRRTIMIVADSSIALATVVLMVLFATERIAVWHVYLLLLVRSLGGAFHYPAMAASTSLMVPGKHLARVAGMNQTLQGIVSIFAPPLGALLLAVMPTQNVLAIDVGTALVAVVPLLFIAIPQPERRRDRETGLLEKTSYWHELREGFRYVLRWPGLLGLILLAMMLNFLLTPTSALTPLVVTKVFQKGAAELGWVEAVFGGGTILGGLLLSIWGGFKRRIVSSMAGVIGVGLGVLLFGLVPANLFYLLLAAALLQGFAIVFANGPLHAIFQSTIAPDFQGRVFSMIGAGAAAMSPLGLLIAGPFADRLGIQTWYVIAGTVCVVAALAAGFVPAIMNIERNYAGAESVPADSRL